MATRTTHYPTRAAFVVDPASMVRNSGRQVDFSQITSGDTTYLDGDSKKVIKAGTVMSEVGGKLRPRSLTITVTAAIASNVATLTYSADHGLAVGDQVRVSGATPDTINGLHTVASVPTSKTVTYAATGSDGAASGTIKVSPAASCILITDAIEDDPSHSLSGYGCYIGGVVYENLLPDATGTPKVLPDDYLTELNSAGTGFATEQYADTRTS